MLCQTNLSLKLVCAYNVMSESRVSRKRSWSSSMVCPLSNCGLTLTSSSVIVEHCRRHVEQLRGDVVRVKRSRKYFPDVEDRRDVRHRALERIQRRRIRRQQRADSAASINSNGNDDNNGLLRCPVCEVVVEEETSFGEHVANCLKSFKQAEEHHDEVVDQDDDDDEVDVETYEWAGETRIRGLSLLGFDLSRSISGLTTIRKGDESDVLDVEHTNENVLGPPQYTETDIANANMDKNDGNDDDRTTKCVVCMDKYSRPVVSTACWHVLCEQCWLRSLKVQKLCPRCKTIVTAGDLRRIFI